MTFMYSKNKKGQGYLVRKKELTDVCPISKNAQKQDELQTDPNSARPETPRNEKWETFTK